MEFSYTTENKIISLTYRKKKKRNCNNSELNNFLPVYRMYKCLETKSREVYAFEISDRLKSSNKKVSFDSIIKKEFTTFKYALHAKICLERKREKKCACNKWPRFFSAANGIFFLRRNKQTKRHRNKIS